MAEVAVKSDLDLSDEQKDFLKMCEEKFANRYTEGDEEYMELYNREVSTPPILPDWNANRDRNYRPNYQQRNYNNRNWNRDRGHNNYNNYRDRGYDNSYNRNYNDSHGSRDRGTKRFYDERQ